MRKMYFKWCDFCKKYDLFALFLGLYFFVDTPVISLSNIIAFPSIITKAILVFTTVVIFFDLPNIIKNIKVIDFVIVGLYLFLCFLSYIFYKNNRNEIVDGLKIFITSLWIYYYIFRFCEETKKRINIVSLGSVFNIFILFIVSIVHLKNGLSENMTLCYETLFFASISLSYAFSLKKISYKVILFPLAFLIGLVAIYIFKSRGPFLFAVVLVIVLIYFKINTKQLKKALLLSCCSVIAVAILLPLVCILTYSSENIFAVKILELYSKAFSLSGRDYLYSLEMSGFTFSPIIGCGLFGDRFLSIGFIFSNPQTTSFSSITTYLSTTYSHNIIVEFLVSFGVPITIMIVILFASFFYRYILKALNNKNNVQVFLLPLLLAGVCSLFLSNSFSVSNYFWAFLGSSVTLYLENQDIFIQKSTNALLHAKHFIELNI